MALVNRRDFLKTNLVGIAGLSLINQNLLFGSKTDTKTQVVVVKTDDRRQGVTAIMETLEYAPMAGKRVLIKPNFNTADPAPGSTHNDTLEQLITELRSRGGEDITIGESSGPPSTNTVMVQKGIIELADVLDFRIINYENLTGDEWIHFNPAGIHWANGFSIPRVAVESEYFVSTCCLKTHGYGGVFTMSLKLAVGLTPKSIRGGMHALSTTHMRRMIAELNLGYQPDLIVLDGIQAFTDGGPSSGRLKQGNVFIGGTDRIAVDAVGLAVLKDLGSNSAIMNRNIFEQEQIQRAVELGLGITSPDQIELIAPDEASRTYADKLQTILDESGATGVREADKMPSDYRISNYPNPFNPDTTIRYSIPKRGAVSLKIYNTLGQEVAALVNNVVKTPGIYQTVFHGANLPSGNYYYRLIASGFSSTGKMMLIR
jgi:uncharacterized protein (DUF362 family)